MQLGRDHGSSLGLTRLAGLAQWAHMDSRVIHLRFEAPAKPAEHAPCNGCGVCCAAEPCPVGVLVSGRRRGACAALQWSDDGARYRCGLVSAPRSVLPWLPESMVPVVRRAVLRWIAAASGCDSSLLAESGPA
jgi:hypothetical protein